MAVMDNFIPDGMENAILEAIAANSVFSAEALRYAYEDSFDDLLKAVTMAQEMGSDNLVRCMKSVLIYKAYGWTRSG